MKKNPEVLIAAAVMDESEHVLESLENPTEEKIGGRRLFKGLKGNLRVSLVLTAPALVNCVHALTCAIQAEKPDLIIQIGCAGAFRKSSLKLGDIGIAEQEMDANLGIEPSSGNLMSDPLPFPVLKYLDRNFTNRYPLPEKWTSWAEKIVTADLGDDIKVKKCPFLTVSEITATDYRADLLFKETGAGMESMEGSGAAHVSLLYEIPFIEIRAASNFVGKRQRDKWNLSLAFENSGRAAIALLNALNDENKTAPW